MTKDISEEIIEELADFFNKDIKKISLDSNLVDDLGADSLDMVEAIMLFEEKYNITITDKEAVNVKTVGDLIEKIKELKE